MAPRSVRRGVLAGIVAVAGMAAGPAGAQDLTVYGTASVDGAETGIVLAGVHANLGALGLVPVLDAQAYSLWFRSGDENDNLFAVNPSAGLGWRAPAGMIEARVGYLILSDEASGPVSGGLGGEGGVNGTVQAQYWGAGLPELLGIASYGFESEYLWSQAQATVPVIRRESGANVGVGAEVVWEGGMGDSEGLNDFQAFSVGPVLKWSNGRTLSASVSAGYKKRDETVIEEETWYARVSIARFGIGL